MLLNFTKSRIQLIEPEIVRASNLRVFVLRDDLSHPYLSGNKWRKLKYNLTDFDSSGKRVILTFGGKYSNHLVACAAAGKMYNIPMIGILRGDEIVSNPNIRFLQSCGMKLLSISRENYRLREDPEFLKSLFEKCAITFHGIMSQAEDIFMIPEGGSNTAGVKGCMEIVQDLPESTTHIITACGTGSTLAGIAAGSRTDQQSIGISVLRGENFLLDSVLSQGAPASRTSINFDYHFGGYAKSDKKLKRFCSDFTSGSGIPLEPVYTGKLFYAVMDMISNGYFPAGANISIVHTGGIFDFDKTPE